MASSITTAVASAVSLAGIWVLLVWMYRDYRVDLFRQRMFSLRDELFDLAADSHIGFGHPAYRQLRDTLNGYIRFGDRLHAVPVLACSALLQDGEAQEIEAEYTRRWSESTAGLDKSIIDSLNEFRMRMHREAVVQMIAASPLFTLAAAPLLAIALIFALCVGGLKRAVGTVDGTAPMGPHLRRQFLGVADSAALSSSCVAA